MALQADYTATEAKEVIVTYPSAYSEITAIWVDIPSNAIVYQLSVYETKDQKSNEVPLTKSLTVQGKFSDFLEMTQDSFVDLAYAHVKDIQSEESSQLKNIETVPDVGA